MSGKKSQRPPEAPRGDNVVVLRPDLAAPAPVRKPARSAKAPEPIGTEDAERALAEMARLLSPSPGVPEAMRAQLNVVSNVAQARAAYIVRYSEERNLLLVEHARGRTDDRIEAAIPGEGIVGEAFSSGVTTRDDERIATPLVINGAVVGALCILSSRRAPSDVLMEALAAHVAAAWEVARLRDEAGRKNKDLQTAVAGLKSLELHREELLGNVSHDLKNPLTTVKAYLALLQRGKLGELTDQQKRAVQICDRNSDRLLRMINELLLISRLQSGKMQLDDKPFGLKDLVEDSIEALTPATEHLGVRLELKPSGEVYVRGDRERVSEAISNVIEHAIGLSPPGSPVQLALEAGNGFARLTVRDGGPGLTEESLRHVFDTYWRPAPGTPRRPGLALPLVAKIAQAHGGRAEAENLPEGGTAIHLFLPLFAGALQSAETTIASLRAGEILLVEDDADCREVLQQVLEQEGYHVSSVESASSALERLVTMRPAMVLLDLKLSQEDGRSVLHHLRSTPPLEDTVVYLITGASEAASLKTGTGVDRIDGVFEKPINLPKLLDTVAATVRPRRAALEG